MDPSTLLHRPWPLPAGPWVMSQSWRDLLFAHWPVPEAALRALVPEPLEIDTFEGTAWIAAVPFRMAAVRPRALPTLPGLSSFLELNLRTYVRLGDRPGVFFFSLDAASRFAVALGRRGFALPYFCARISCTADGDGHLYRSLRTHPGEPAVRFAASYRPAGERFAAAPGTLDHFLTERYCLYACGSSVGGPAGDLFRAEVHHPPWPLQPATAELDAAPLLGSVGLAPAAAETPRLLYAKRIDVRMWPRRRIA